MNRQLVKIDGKDYFMQSSAWTQFKYRDVTGRKLSEDITKIKKLESKDDDVFSLLDDCVEIILQMAYVMILEADSKQVGTFEDFLKSINTLFDDIEWVYKVINLAYTPLYGGNKTNPQQSTK